MLFARMSEGRERSFCATSRARRRVSAHGDSTAVVSQASKARARSAVSRLKISAEIMEAHATADDKHPFIAQRSESATGSDVQRRIK